MIFQASPERERLYLAAIGALAGLALWFLVVRLADLTESRRLVLALVALVGGFFLLLLTSWGPLRGGQALKLATFTSLPAAGLLSWASLRHDEVGDFLASGHVVIAWLILLALPVPFLIAAMRAGEGWRDYRALFGHAWNLAIRLLVAGAFVGLFWLLILLSDQVLQIVGLDMIERLLDLAPVPWLASGAMLGLGLAVVYELRAYVSPFLALRLLRLMLPLVLAVSALFLLAAPLRGLSNLFGALSPAALLMAMAGAALVLITAVVDGDDTAAAKSRFLCLSARLMALLLVFLAALAALAIGQRVAQYGWSPTRLAAALLAAVLLGYGLAYASAVLRGAGWMGRIRRANIAMALVTIALAGLWLSPILNAERIAVNSQIARFESGRIAPDALDLWAIGHEWGRAGAAALARLSAPQYPHSDALAEPLARLAASSSRWQWQRDANAAQTGETVGVLAAMIATYPPGAKLPASLPDSSIPAQEIVEACQRTTAAGNSGCLAWIADFSPAQTGAEILLLWLDETGRTRWHATSAQGAPLFSYSSREGHDGGFGANLIDQIIAGRLRLDVGAGNFLLIGESLIWLKEN